MSKNNIFYLDESPIYKNRFLIKVKGKDFFCNKVKGSYNVLPAHLMGLDYAWYLRMCRDMFGAEIYGKNHKYPVPYFSDKVLAEQLLKYLNTCAEIVIWDKKNAKNVPMMKKKIKEIKKERIETKALHNIFMKKGQI